MKLLTVKVSLRFYNFTIWRRQRQERIQCMTESLLQDSLFYACEYSDVTMVNQAASNQVLLALYSKDRAT